MSETGNGNLPVVRVDNEFCTGEVYLHGATVTAWQPKGQGPVLWLSERSAFDGEAPIRGGVPICFPWFGPGRHGDKQPSHGWARVSEWSFGDSREVDGARTKVQQGAIALTGETDRVYLSGADVAIDDPTLGRRLVIKSQGARNTVVWNPWIAKAAAMPDFGDDEWTGMVCVEAANALDESYSLKPGGSHTLATRITVA